MRIAEIKKDAYEFKRDIVTGAENFRTGKIIAEKAVRYMEDKVGACLPLCPSLRPPLCPPLCPPLRPPLCLPLCPPLCPPVRARPSRQRCGPS